LRVGAAAVFPLVLFFLLKSSGLVGSTTSQRCRATKYLEMPVIIVKTIQVFADRVLNSTDLLCGADDLVDRGILRKGFARFLWNMDGGRGTRNSSLGPLGMKPAKFEEILEEIGVTIPLPELVPEAPAEGSDGRNASALTAGKTETVGKDDIGDDDGTDLLVIMRLPPEPDADARAALSSVRELALGSGHHAAGLKVVFEFDHAGAPQGLPERVIALSHKIGTFSRRARWRYGGIFILRNNGDSNHSSSSMVLEYDKKLKLFSIQALGWTAPCFQAAQFVISALFHVASDFPGANWTGWVECGMGHDGEKMYHLAPSDEKQVSTAQVVFEAAAPGLVAGACSFLAVSDGSVLPCPDVLFAISKVLLTVAVGQPMNDVFPGCWYLCFFSCRSALPEPEAGILGSTSHAQLWQQPRAQAVESVQYGRLGAEGLLYRGPGCFRQGAGRQGAV